MRTRERVNRVGLLWLALAMLNIARMLPKFQHHMAQSEVAFDLIYLMFWSGLAALWVPIIAFNSWRVDPTSVNHRLLWKTREIPMNCIVAIRPKQPSIQVSGSPLEIEVGRFGANVYPHDYIIANPADREGFLRAVRMYAPQIPIEA
jgi:hypothetical protein